MAPRLVGWATVLLALAIVSVSGCSGSKQAPSDVDPKLTNTAFMEDGQLVNFIVGVRATKSRADRDYIPIQIAIVNKGLAGLTVNREFFTLIDEDGNRYAPVGREELQRGYPNPDLDRRLGDLDGVVRGKYQSYPVVPSTLTPTFDRPVLLETKLPRFTLMVDWLYFPRPEGGVKERRFELFLDSPELPDPVFVRFRVAG
jgi:hypothetical protein